MHDKSIQQGTGDREEEKKKRIGPHDQQGMRAEFKPRRKERWKCNLVRRVTSTGKRQCLLIQDRPCQWGAHRIFKAILVFREMPFSLPVHLIPASQRPDFWGIVAMPPIAFFRESPDPKGEIVELVDIVGNPGGKSSRLTRLSSFGWTNHRAKSRRLNTPGTDPSSDWTLGPSGNLLQRLTVIDCKPPPGRRRKS